MSYRFYYIWSFFFVGTLLWMQAPLNETSSGEILGNILKPKGSIMLRRTGSFTWKKAKEHDAVFELDSIATGTKSTAFIQLSDDTRLFLPADTQLKIQKQNFQNGLDIVITRGLLSLERKETSKAQKNSAAIRITTSKLSFEIPKEKGIVLAVKDEQIASNRAENIQVEAAGIQTNLKDFAKKIANTNLVSDAFFGGQLSLKLLDLPTEVNNLEDLSQGKNNKLIELMKSSNELKKPLEPTVLPSSEQADPPKEPEKKTQIKPVQTKKVKKVEILALGPPPEFSKWTHESSTLWRFESLRTGNPGVISLDFAKPIESAEGREVITSILCQKTGKTMYLPLAVGAEEIKFSLDDLTPILPDPGDSKLIFILKLGWLEKSKTPNTATFDAKETKLTLRTLPSGEWIRISLEGWTKGGNDDKWIPESLPDPQRLTLDLYLTERSEWSALLPYIRGAKGFQIQAVQRAPESGINLVKASSILGVTSVLDNTALESIKSWPTFDLIFSGPSSSYTGKGKNTDLQQYLAEGKNLYYFHRGNWQKVDRDLILSLVEASKMLQKSIPNFFSKPVDMLFLRPD